MKFKAIFPWILVVSLGVSLVAVYLKSASQNQELQQLRGAAEELDQVRAELEEAQQKAQLPDGQVIMSRQDKDELIRLRGEVSKLRDDQKRLTQQIQTVRSEADSARAQATQLLHSERSNVEKLAVMETNQKRDACINNLRQIHAAKQQWAMENNQVPESVPPPQAIAAYLTNNTFPSCPAQGAYILNAVGQIPTCSVQGHTLQ
jgi:hypothetical protein